jgi:undecaprenyl-diphosphatase
MSIDFLNTHLFTVIYGFSHQSTVLDYLGIFFAEYSQYVLALIFLILIFYPKQDRVRNRSMVVMATLSALVARLIIKPFILLFYSEPRPFMVLHYVRPLISTSASENFQSFPSGHALFFFALATTVYLFNKKWGLFYLISALLIGVARVYVGIHWPFDIIAGMFIGIITGWLSFLLYTRFTEPIKKSITFIFKKLHLS